MCLSSQVQNRTENNFPSGVFVTRLAALGILIPIFQDSLASRTCQELMDAGQWGQSGCGSSVPSAAAA